MLISYVNQLRQSALLLQTAMSNSHLNQLCQTAMSISFVKQLCQSGMSISYVEQILIFVHGHLLDKISLCPMSYVKQLF